MKEKEKQKREKCAQKGIEKRRFLEFTVTKKTTDKIQQKSRDLSKLSTNLEQEDDQRQITIEYRHDVLRSCQILHHKHTRRQSSSVLCSLG